MHTAVVRSVVELVDVSKEYATADGMLRALDRVSLEIGDGEFVSVLGPSGCGKSTLMLIVAGLVAPTFGHRARRGCRSPGAVPRRRDRLSGCHAV